MNMRVLAKERSNVAIWRIAAARQRREIP